MAPGQTVRFSAVNLVQAPAGTACRVELSYVGPNGGALFNAGSSPLALEFEPAQRVASSLDFQSSSDTLTTLARPVIRLVGTPNPASPQCGIELAARGARADRVGRIRDPGDAGRRVLEFI